MPSFSVDIPVLETPHLILRGYVDKLKLPTPAKGQRADFLLLDADPLLAGPADLRAIKVLQTWVGGTLAWQAGDAAAKPAGDATGR